MPTYAVTTQSGERFTVEASNDDEAWDQAAMLKKNGDTIASVELTGPEMWRAQCAT